MSRSKHQWVQAELKPAPGAELWFVVRYRGGWFRLPADAPISDLVEGVARGWQNTPPRKVEGEMMIRVPLRWLQEAQARQEGPYSRRTVGAVRDAARSADRAEGEPTRAASRAGRRGTPPAR